MLKFCLLQPNLAKQLPGHLSSGFSEPGIRLGPLWTSAHWHLTETLWRKCLQTNYTYEDMEAQGSWVTYLMAHSKKGGRAGIQRLSDQSLLSTLLPCPCHAPLWVCVCVFVCLCVFLFSWTQHPEVGRRSLLPRGYEVSVQTMPEVALAETYCTLFWFLLSFHECCMWHLFCSVKNTLWKHSFALYLLIFQELHEQQE